MGLDMYLSEKQWHRVSDVTRLRALRDILDVDALPVGEMTVTTDVEHIYWRKANAIHGWFVDNIQDGEDDCGEYPVAREDLQKLKNLCEQVLEDPDLADDLLPARPGCFFGSQQYGEDYLEDLRHTVTSIDELIKHLTVRRLKDPNYVFKLVYQSSW